MSSVTGYSRAQIILHWLTAIGVLTAWFTHEALEEAFATLKETAGTPYPTVHTVAGFTVFFLVVIRLVLRAWRGAPEPEGAGLQLQAAIWGHRLLYLLLLGVPLGGFTTWILGVHGLGDLHGLAGNVLLAVALGHAAMALWHHYVRKDGTLRRMMRAG